MVYMNKHNNKMQITKLKYETFRSLYKFKHLKCSIKHIKYFSSLCERDRTKTKFIKFEYMMYENNNLRTKRNMITKRRKSARGATT
jgi:hypothetical protein